MLLCVWGGAQKIGKSLVFKGIQKFVESCFRKVYLSTKLKLILVDLNLNQLVPPARVHVHRGGYYPFQITVE